MSYEKSLISDSPSAIPTQQPSIMREDREIDPYRHSKATVKATEAQNGQANINSDKAIPAATEETPAETVTLSPHMAALARKEQKFRQNEQALKTREAALEKERAEIADLKALKAKIEAKDYSGLENLVKYEDYTNYLIEKESNLTPEQQALKKLEAKLEGLETSQKEDVSKRFEAAVNERRKAVVALVDTNEAYSSIKELKLQEAVVQHILDTWEHDNVDLSPEDAAKEVEAELIERAGKWSSLSKLKAKSDSTVEQKQLPPLKPGIKTLTNNMAATGEIKRTAKSFQHMSDTERYEEARRRAVEKLQQQGK